jgi:hypothetical protein
VVLLDDVIQVERWPASTVPAQIPGQFQFINSLSVGGMSIR